MKPFIFVFLLIISGSCHGIGELGKYLLAQILVGFEKERKMSTYKMSSDKYQEDRVDWPSWSCYLKKKKKKFLSMRKDDGAEE